jgi:hypothetical protein
MRCTNSQPQTCDGKLVPPLYRSYGPAPDVAQWAPCGAQMTCQGEIPTTLPKGDGRAPVAVLTYTCPDCGASQTVNEFGRLDGIKKTPKKDLFKEKTVKLPRSKFVKYRYITKDLKGHEVFFAKSTHRNDAQTLAKDPETHPGSMRQYL